MAAPVYAWQPTWYESLFVNGATELKRTKDVMWIAHTEWCLWADT